jgi:hypothetical protein
MAAPSPACLGICAASVDPWHKSQVVTLARGAPETGCRCRCQYRVPVRFRGPIVPERGSATNSVRAVDRAADLAPTIAQFCSFFGGTASQTTW